MLFASQYFNEKYKVWFKNETYDFIKLIISSNIFALLIYFLKDKYIVCDIKFYNNFNRSEKKKSKLT